MKIISIRDEVYNQLLNLKNEGESFSDVIERLLKRKNKDIRRYFGSLKESEVLDEIEKVLEMRKTARFRI